MSYIIRALVSLKNPIRNSISYSFKWLPGFNGFKKQTKFLWYYLNLYISKILYWILKLIPVIVLEMQPWQVGRSRSAIYSLKTLNAIFSRLLSNTVVKICHELLNRS